MRTQAKKLIPAGLAIALLLGLSAGLFALSADIAHAQTKCTGKDGFVPLECFEKSRRLKNIYQESGNLGDFLQRIFVGTIALGAILAVFRLAWAGFQYMGSDNWGSKEKAREIIRDTLLGLFLLIAVALILQQINPNILNLNIEPRTPPSSPSSSGGTAPDPGSADPFRSPPTYTRPPGDPGGSFDGIEGPETFVP